MKALIVALLLVSQNATPAAAPEHIVCAQKTYFQANVWADPSYQFCEDTE